jgi:hypothetical protein
VEAQILVDRVTLWFKEHTCIAKVFYLKPSG